MGYAFRCRNCNSLVPSEWAQGADRPTKCSTCGAGVSFDTSGVRTDDPDNWIVLAELSPEELAPILAYHALDPSEIEAHVNTGPAPDPAHVPVAVAVEAGESTASEDQQ